MLYFIRHGESQSNADLIIASTTYPTQLTAIGIEQARQAGRSLINRKINIDYIIASPLERTQQTAMIVANEIGFDANRIMIDSRLTEYDMGILAGKSMIGVTAKQRVTAIGAETPIHFRNRILDAISELSKLNGNVLLVSHAGVGRMIEAMQLGIETALFYDVDGYPNAKVISLDDKITSFLSLLST